MKSTVCFFLFLSECLFIQGLQAQEKIKTTASVLQVTRESWIIDERADKVDIYIDFNLEVDKSTVIWNKTLFLTSLASDTNILVYILWRNEGKRIIVTPRKPFSQYRYGSGSGGTDLKLTLKGSSKSIIERSPVKATPGGIKTVGGIFLDGNRDFKEGGDYVYTFRLIQ